MRTTRTTRRTPVLLLAVVALLVGIAGTATAAKLITGAQIQDGSVTGKDVKNGSLTKRDLTGSLRGETGPPGPEGPAGPAGPAGSVGPQGRPGVSGLTYPTVARVITADKSESWSVPCPAGKKAVGGGVSSVHAFRTTIRQSAPLNDGAGWTVIFHNGNGYTVTAYAWAACVNAS